MSEKPEKYTRNIDKIKIINAYPTIFETFVMAQCDKFDDLIHALVHLPKTARILVYFAEIRMFGIFSPNDYETFRESLGQVGLTDIFVNTSCRIVCYVSNCAAIRESPFSTQLEKKYVRIANVGNDHHTLINMVLALEC